MTKSMTKSQAAALVRSGLLTECFAHDTLGMFDVSALRRLIAEAPDRWEICAADLTPETLEFIQANREIDPARVAELTPAEADEPILALACPDGEHLFIDGHHRLVRRHQLGHKTFLFYNIPLADAPRLLPGGYVDVPWGEMDIPTEPGALRRRPT